MYSRRSGVLSSTSLAACALLFFSAHPTSSSASTLRVGPGKFYKTVRAAAEAAWAGDIVLVDAGVYAGDVVSWKADNISVRGVGGRAHLRADGAQEAGKGIWVVSGRNFTAENIEFSGASVSDRNGAGVRAEGTGTLILRNCYFHDNENGILGTSDSVLVENCIFDRNGAGDGRTHNLYVWGRSFVIRHSYVHRAVVGHEIKTRAKNNYILYNRITNEADGTASYEIDIPDGGRTYIIGNMIEQGPKSENSGIISYGAESADNVQDLYMINNTIVNHRGKDATFLKIRDGALARVTNNIFVGSGTTWSGGVVTADHNEILPSDKENLGFESPPAHDFRLTPASSRKIVDAGVAPGVSASGYDLTPNSEYVHEACGRKRPLNGALDLGAFELNAAAQTGP